MQYITCKSCLSFVPRAICGMVETPIAHINTSTNTPCSNHIHWNHHRTSEMFNWQIDNINYIEL